MTNDLTPAEREVFAAEQGGDDYREFLDETLGHAIKRIRNAQAALNDARVSAQVDAVIAVRAGHTKVATANRLGISRPTLDEWLNAVESEPDLMARVTQHEQFVARRLHKTR